MDIRKQQTQKNYNEIAGLYTDDFEKKIAFFDKFIDPLVLDLNKNNLKKPIIDLGTGSGNVIDYLVKLGVKIKIIGVDFSQKFCDFLKSKYLKSTNIKIISNDFVDYVAKQPNNSVSAYISNYSIIHVLDEEIGDLMNNIQRSLQINGMVLFSVYEGVKKGMELEPYQIDKDPRFIGKTKEKLASYINNFTEEEIKNIFTNVGLKIVKMQKFQLEDTFGEYNQPEFWVLAQK